MTDRDTARSTGRPGVAGPVPPLPDGPGSGGPGSGGPGSGGPGGPSHRTSPLPWALAIVVILLLVAGVLATLLVRADRDRSASPTTSGPPAGVSTSPAGTASASTSASTSSAAGTSASAAPSGSASPTPPGLLARGKQAPAGAVPWGQVDAGWNLRAWNPRPAPTAEPVASTLYLVNPIGGRYRMATLPANTILSRWSPDRRRALLTAFSTTGRAVVHEIDLVSGRTLSSFALGNRSLVGYAGPGGRSLLLATQAANNLTVYTRVNTAGIAERALPTSGSRAGWLTGTPVYSADGLAFLIRGEHGFGLISNDGLLLRQIMYPAKHSCDVEHWWSAGVALGRCWEQLPDGRNSPSNLVLVSARNGAITPITRLTSPEDYGFDDAWPYSGGIIAQRMASCGAGPIVTIDRNGADHPYPFRLPAGASGQASVTGVHADHATLITGNCGERGRSLISLDLNTRVATVLLGAGLNGGTVLG